MKFFSAKFVLEFQHYFLKFILGSSVLIFGCVHKPNLVVKENPENRFKIEEGQKLLSQRKSLEARELFAKFIQENPHSQWFAEANLGQAEADLYLKKYELSAQTLEGIKLRVGPQNSFFVRAALLQSRAFYFMGDFVKARAALKEVDQEVELLQAEDRKVLWPLLQGLMAYRDGDKDRGRANFRRTIEGLNKLYGTQEDPLSRRKRAEVLFEIADQPLPPERSRAMQDFRALQKFLLKATSEEATEISERSRMLWKTRMEGWFETIRDPKADRADLEVMSEMLQELKAEFLPVVADTQTQKLRSDLYELEKKTYKQLMQWSGPSPMTKEAQDRNSLKLEGLKLVPVQKQ